MSEAQDLLNLDPQYDYSKWFGAEWVQDPAELDRFLAREEIKSAAYNMVRCIPDMTIEDARQTAVMFLLEAVARIQEKELEHLLLNPGLFKQSAILSAYDSMRRTSMAGYFAAGSTPITCVPEHEFATPSYEDEILDNSIMDETLRYLFSALRRMPEHDRLLIQLRFGIRQPQYSLEEIATITGYPSTGALSQQLRKTYALFKIALERVQAGLPGLGSTENSPKTKGAKRTRKARALAVRKTPRIRRGIVTSVKGASGQQ